MCCYLHSTTFNINMCESLCSVPARRHFPCVDACRHMQNSRTHAHINYIHAHMCIPTQLSLCCNNLTIHTLWLDVPTLQLVIIYHLWLLLYIPQLPRWTLATRQLPPPLPQQPYPPLPPPPPPPPPRDRGQWAVLQALTTLMMTQVLHSHIVWLISSALASGVAYITAQQYGVSKVWLISTYIHCNHLIFLIISFWHQWF